MRSLFTLLLWSAFLGTALGETALELHVPRTVQAGDAIAITSSGTGSGTFYLIGPGHVAKRQFRAGDTIQIASDELQSAGTYQAMACRDRECATTSFYVAPSRGAELIFLVHPSRVAVAEPKAISAVVVVLDRFQNLATQPENVTFRVTSKATTVSSPPQMTVNGVVWTRLNSGPNDGLVEISASLSQLSERRVVEQVAAEPCNLRASGVRKGDRIVLQTDPVRDCRGNPVRDGTVVTFTKLDRLGRSTVDAPIKRGVARTEMGFGGPATVSVACGVVVGSDIRIGGAQ
jgi:hypothetical protein